MRVLTALNRFRVIRTFDIAALCFPERPYKAALTAGQRAMRGLKKHGYVLPYITDRHQHVYGLTKKGADWLEERLHEGAPSAAPSVRRVADMTNPEHLIWANFIAVSCEARGLVAQTESEVLINLNEGRRQEATVQQSLLDIRYFVGKDLNHERRWRLRPDAIALEDDGVTWFEIDRSKRGASRKASLRALFRSVGAPLKNGRVLKRVVVLAKTPRTFAEALATARAMGTATKDPASAFTFASKGQMFYREQVQDNPVANAHVFELWKEERRQFGNNLSKPVPVLAGHVVVQMLPTWLPNVRFDGRKPYCTAGWFAENYLPYCRPSGLPPWPLPRTPLLA